MKTATMPVSPAAIARVQRARDAGATFTFFRSNVTAKDAAGNRMFAAAQLDGDVFALLPDGRVTKLTGGVK